MFPVVQSKIPSVSDFMSGSKAFFYSFPFLCVGIFKQRSELARRQMVLHGIPQEVPVPLQYLISLSVYFHATASYIIGLPDVQVFPNDLHMSFLFSLFSTVNPCCSFPCQHWGVCVRYGQDKYECDCTRTGYYGENCTVRKSVFLCESGAHILFYCCTFQEFQLFNLT